MILGTVHADEGLGAGPGPTASPFDDGLDTELYVANTSARLGEIYNTYGSASCEQVSVTLTFTTYDGQRDFASRHANTVYDRSSGRYRFTLQYRAPDEAAPSNHASLFADTLCGNPDAAPSEQVPVRVLPAELRLHAPTSVQQGQALTVVGTGCFGSETAKVVVRGDAASQWTARVIHHRFTVRGPAPSGQNGWLTVAVPDPSCPGSAKASERIRVLPASQGTMAPAFHATPRPASTPPASPAVSPPAKAPTSGPTASALAASPPSASSSSPRHGVDTPRVAVAALIALFTAVGVWLYIRRRLWGARSNE
jgi:hypothetical protein